MTITERTPLFDYQEFCELLDHIQTLKDLTSQNKNDAAVYRKKIQQVCERVEKDFCDKHHFFASWVARKPIILDSGDEVTLNGDRKVIFVILILNRRRELGLPMFQSDINEFYALCKKANTNFPKGYFKGA